MFLVKKIANVIIVDRVTLFCEEEYHAKIPKLRFDRVGMIDIKYIDVHYRQGDRLKFFSKRRAYSLNQIIYENEFLELNII